MHSSDDILPTLGWHCTSAAQATHARDFPPVDEDSPILRHTAMRDVTTQDEQIIICEAAQFQEGELYVASAWIWLPENFTGWLGVTFKGRRWIKMWPVDAGQHNRWQRLATSFRCHSSKDVALPGLADSITAGSEFYSSCWRVERGVIPIDNLPLLTGFEP